MSRAEDHPEDPQLPPRLADELRLLYQHRIDVPRDLEQSISAEARFHFRRRAHLRLLLRWSGGAAAAAAIAVAVWLWPEHAVLVRQDRSAVAARQDLNGDGSVDILDAYELARRLEGGQAPAGADVTGDGRTDRRDVDALALAAVRVEKGAVQ